MNSIRDRIFSDKKGKEFTAKDIPEMHNDFMECYGWIPLSEFKKIPLPILWNLAPFVQKAKKLRYENNQMLKVIAKCLGAKINLRE